MSINNFLEQVLIIDTETTGIDYSNDDIIELAVGYYDNNTWKCDSELFSPVNSIPPEASAVHFISNRMVQGKKTFVQNINLANNMIFGRNKKYFVAHNSRFDHEMISSSFKRASMQYNINFEDWICTWRLSRMLHGVNYVKYNYDQGHHSLSYLRFSLDLDVPEHMQAHRADTDVLTTGLLLEKLIDICLSENLLNPNNIGRQLQQLSWNPINIPIWPLGKKHRGKPITELDNDYIFWAMDNLDLLKEDHVNYDCDLAYSLEKELEARVNNK